MLSSHGQYAHEGALITNITRSGAMDRSRSASQLTTLARQRAMSDLIDALPSPELGDFLVAECASCYRRRLLLLHTDIADFAYWFQT